MRLIDADALIKTLNEEKIKFNADVNYFILNAPTIDAEPVSHGKWIHQEYKGIKYQNIGYYVCSECGYVVLGMDKMNRYCSYCGAKMEGEEE